VDEVPIPARNDESEVFKRVASYYDVPAYVRRGRRVQDIYDVLLARCRQKRAELAAMVRMRLGMVQAFAGEWAEIRFLLADDEQIDLLQTLVTLLEPKLRAPIEPTTSRRILRRELGELIASLERFNRRWREFLEAVDLTEVNAERDGYNRYYILEKECAIRSPALARQGFRRLEPLTHADLFAHLPLLGVPRLAD
jgi:hypothetical protein